MLEGDEVGGVSLPSHFTLVLHDGQSPLGPPVQISPGLSLHQLMASALHWMLFAVFVPVSVLSLPKIVMLPVVIIITASAITTRTTTAIIISIGMDIAFLPDIETYTFICRDEYINVWPCKAVGRIIEAKISNKRIRKRRKTQADRNIRLQVSI